MIVRAEYDLRRYRNGLSAGMPISSSVLGNIDRSNGGSASSWRLTRLRYKLILKVPVWNLDRVVWLCWWSFYVFFKNPSQSLLLPPIIFFWHSTTYNLDTKISHV